MMDRILIKEKGASKIKKYLFGLSLLSIVMVFVVLLFAKTPVNQPTIQLSKIDFLREPSGLKVTKIVEKIRQTKGVVHVKYFEGSKSLVTSFDNTKLTTKDVEVLVASLSKELVRPVKFSSDQAKSGCPVHNPQVILGWFKKFIF